MPVSPECQAKTEMGMVSPECVPGMRAGGLTTSIPALIMTPHRFHVLGRNVEPETAELIRMPHPTSFSRASTIFRRLSPALMLLSVLGWRGEVRASTISLAPAAALDADEHFQYCRCRNCGGSSCCCGPRRAKAVAPRVATNTERAKPGYGPSLSSAPCDEAGLPDAPIPGPSCKVAAASTHPHRFSPAAGRPVPPVVRCILPSRRASRLDEPPERPAFA